MAGAGVMSTEQLIMGSDPSEFHECAFWDRFYATCGGKAFEWYGSWPDIATLVLDVAERDEPALVLGCGKYAGSADLPGGSPPRPCDCWRALTPAPAACVTVQLYPKRGHEYRWVCCHYQH